MLMNKTIILLYVIALLLVIGNIILW